MVRINEKNLIKLFSKEFNKNINIIEKYIYKRLAGMISHNDKNSLEKHRDNYNSALIFIKHIKNCLENINKKREFINSDAHTLTHYINFIHKYLWTKNFHTTQRFTIIEDTQVLINRMDNLFSEGYLNHILEKYLLD